MHFSSREISMDLRPSIRCMSCGCIPIDRVLLKLSCYCYNYSAQRNHQQTTVIIVIIQTTITRTMKCAAYSLTLAPEAPRNPRSPITPGLPGIPWNSASSSSASSSSSSSSPPPVPTQSVYYKLRVATSQSMNMHHNAALYSTTGACIIINYVYVTTQRT